MKPSARNPLNFNTFFGGVAQLIEQSVHTRSVGGLNPLAATFSHIFALVRKVAVPGPRWTATFFLISWGFLLYANTLHAEFFFDDYSNIVANPLVHNLAGIGELFSQYSTRFLAYLSFAVNYRFCPVDPFGFHLTNIVIHVTTGVLVYVLIKNLYNAVGRNADGLALFSSLLFLSHPLQTQAAAYTSQRVTALCALFYIATILLYRQRRYIPALLTTVAAMLTKEISFTLPFALLLCEWLFPQKDSSKEKSQRLLPFFCTLVIIPVLLWTSFSQRMEIAGLTKVAEDISRSQYLLTQANVVVTYLHLLILPFGQNVDYDYPLTQSLDLATILSMVIIAGILFAAWRILKHNRLVTFGILWFFLTLSVESSIIPINDVIQEHRLYLPMFGFVLVAGEGLAQLQNRRLRILAMAAVIAVFSLLTYQRNELWKDPVGLWKDTIAKSPHKARPYTNLGMVLIAKGEYAEAKSFLKKSLKIKPSADAYSNLGSVLLLEGQPLKAKEYLEKAVTLDKKHVVSRINLANLLIKDNQLAGALAVYQEILKIEPRNTAILRNAAALAMMTSQGPLAEEFYKQALEQDPQDANTWLEYGKLYGNYDRFDKAIAIWEKGWSIHPTDTRFAPLIEQARSLQSTKAH